MKTFISYQSGIKRLAGRIKRHLDRYDFNCFLAHDDIPPQSRWLAEIEQNLYQCDLFIPLLTEESETSIFCQQEIGFAYARKTEILPVLISTQPAGLIAGVQGIPFSTEDFENSCWNIVKHVGKKTQFSDLIIDKIIDEFGQSNSFDQAGKNAENILLEFDFNTAQLQEIMEHISQNNQIYNSRSARTVIYDFIEKYGDELDPDKVGDYKSDH
jgi:hypothetical protein